MLSREAGIAALLGLATIGLVRYVWGDWTPVPQFHDEAAYALQAEIYASGRWSAPSPPEPRFFEQTHVLVKPVLAAKYLPGHSLLLALGALVGWTGLIPLLLSGLTGALVYALAARVATPAVGFLTWGLWATSPENLHWRVSYFSELTTGALLLLAWWLLLRWKERPTGRRLAFLALVVGWGAITRPLTMLALAVPMAWVVLARVGERRAWRQLGVAIAVGGATLLLWPVWSWATLGSLSPTPHALYTEQYMPWDRLGFELETRPPTEGEPAEVAAISREFVALHRAHTAERLPGILLRRVRYLLFPSGSGWRGALVAVGLIGLLAHWKRARFAAVSAAALILSYGLYAHPPHWAVYYVEIMPVGAFLAALGLWWLGDRVGRATPRPERTRVILFGVLLGLLTPPTVAGLQSRRALEGWFRRDLVRFEACVGRLERPAGVFVRHASDHDPHRSYVRNVADLDAAPLVTALDRGAENARLVAALSDRAWHVFDEASWSLAPWRGGSERGTRIDCPRSPGR